MRPAFCFLFLMVVIAKVYAQKTISPGGVKSPVTWYITDSSARIPTFRSAISGVADSLIWLPHGQAYHPLNFHTCIFFGGNDTLSIPLPDSSMSSCSLFSVYESTAPDMEGAVWHTVKQGQTMLVSTTKRVADLESFNYMNFNDVVPGNPKVSVYAQQKTKETYYPIHQFWNIGYKPASPTLPVYSFKGVIPEIIAYKRVLTGTERLKVMSYLAIKYGITITDPNATYLDSSGDILWDGLNYTDYYHNITGIGRDDTSALVQPKSTSSNSPGLLTISATKLSNYNFLVWGDNDKPLSVGGVIPGMPSILQKKWLVAAHTGGLPLTTEVVVDIKQIDAALPAKPVYWLAIDRTGNGDFPTQGTEFIKMSTLDDDGHAHFTNVQWGLNGNNREVMGLFVGDNVLATTSIIAPVCSTSSGGRLKIKISSGQAPYHVVVADNGSNLLDGSFNTADTIIMNNVSDGKYSLSITDANQQKYTNSFYVNNADGPQPSSIASAYTLQQGMPLTLRADSLMPAGVTYLWNGPNAFQSASPEVLISQAGTYHLTCTKDGCSYQQDITISPSSFSGFTSLYVFPNPATGPYTADISLDSPAPVHLTVSSINGTVIKTADVSGMAHYRFTGMFQKPGMYILTFTSGQHSQNWKESIVN